VCATLDRAAVMRIVNSETREHRDETFVQALRVALSS
jgi:hypothetical protein